MQYVPLGPSPKRVSTGKAETAPFKPPHAGSTGPLGKPYAYVPCPELKQVLLQGRRSIQKCLLVETAQTRRLPKAHQNACAAGCATQRLLTSFAAFSYAPEMCHKAYVILKSVLDTV